MTNCNTHGPFEKKNRNQPSSNFSRNLLFGNTASEQHILCNKFTLHWNPHLIRHLSVNRFIFLLKGFKFYDTFSLVSFIFWNSSPSFRNVCIKHSAQILIDHCNKIGDSLYSYNLSLRVSLTASWFKLQVLHFTITKAYPLEAWLFFETQFKILDSSIKFHLILG